MSQGHKHQGSAPLYRPGPGQVRSPRSMLRTKGQPSLRACRGRSFRGLLRHDQLLTPQHGRHAGGQEAHGSYLDPEAHQVTVIQSKKEPWGWWVPGAEKRG